MSYAVTLTHSQLFRGVPQPALEALVAASKIIQAKQGQTLVEAGRSAGALHILLEGGIQIAKTANERISVMGRGNFFGEISVFGMSLGANAAVVATTSVTLLAIERPVLEAWFKKFPDAERLFFRQLATELCNRLYATTEKLVEG
jgi:CRP-like cAMP-binding protein